MSSSRHVSGPSESELESLATETAALFADVYRIQDELESTAELADKWETAAATRACDRMGTIYSREFPEIPTADAKQAGRAHVDALFKQDIIENDPTNETERAVLVDDRWHGGDAPWTVRAALETVCECVEMDTQFADSLTEFYRLHGQGREGWKQEAYRAHKLKVTRITGTRAVGEQLAPYFVISVMHHDAGTWAEGQAVIQEHYERLFELNAMSSRSQPNDTVG